MIDGLLFLLYSILFAVVAYNIIIEYKKRRIINSYICLQTAFLLYYVLIPIIINFVIVFYPYNLTGFILKISNSNSYDKIYAYIYTFLAYMIIWMIYNVKMKLNSSHKTITNLKRTVSKCEDLNETEICYLNKKEYQIAFSAGILSLIIGVSAELFVANSLGGILKVITMGDVLRSFVGDKSQYIPQNKLFVILLMVSAIASTYFFVYALRIYNRLFIKILLFISVFASVFYLFIDAGRLGILLFLSTFFTDFVFRKTKHPIFFLGLFSILALLLLRVLNDIFFYLSYGYIKESSSNILSLINEFAFPYLNILNVHKINKMFGLRWGIGYLSWIINIIPADILKMFGMTKITSEYYFVTNYYMSQNPTGGIPTDLLTLSIRQFGVVGILIGGIVIGTLCKYIDKIIDKIYSKKSIFITLRISLIMFTIIPYADLDAFIRNRYDMIMVLIFAIIISKNKNITKTRNRNGNIYIKKL